MNVASETTSLPEAIATARAEQAGQPIGTCGTPEAGTPSAVAPATRAESTPTASLQAAIDQVRQQGYTVGDTRDYDNPSPLHVLIGVKTGSADGFTQRAFFFWQDTYLGTDTANPSAGVSEVWRDSDTVALAYSLYRADDGVCCPTGGATTVRFHWDGGKLAPLDPIPSDNLKADLGRR
jgi:hypothetical protein